MDEGLIDRIYECAFVPEAWPGLLDDISLLAGADAAGMVAVNSAKFRWTCSERLSGPMQFALGDGAFFRSPFNARALETHYDGFKHASELATSDELAGDPMFRDVFRAAGLDGGVGTMVQASTGDKLLLFTLDAIERETPDDKAIARLDVLRPHLARSMLTSARLELERARRRPGARHARPAGFGVWPRRQGCRRQFGDRGA